VHDGHAVPHGGVVQEVAGGEVVGAVDDHVPTLAEDAVDVVGGEALLEDPHVDVRVQSLERSLRRLCLRLAEPLGRVDDLALEVRLVDRVVVDDADRPDAGGSKVQAGGRAQSPGPDEEHAGIEQLLLPLLADLRDEEVAAVAPALRLVERARNLEGKPVALPVREAACEGENLLVPELVQRLGREGGAAAAGAVDDQRPRPVGHRALDTRLQRASRDVNGAGDVTFLPLVPLAHVDHGRVGLRY
jgi:hypothetical protein